MTARSVVVHGPGTDTLDAALRLCGLEPVLHTPHLAVWIPSPPPWETPPSPTPPPQPSTPWAPSGHPLHEQERICARCLFAIDPDEDQLAEDLYATPTTADHEDPQ